MDRLQDHGFDESEYERPNRWWVCGHRAEGKACHVGPDARGRCRASYECSPVRRGDRWECARPARRGGKCEEGPLPDGTCACAIETCQPELSLRAKRGLTTLGAAALTLGLALVLFAGPGLEELRRSVLSPGALSRSHGAIEDCAVCHVAGDGEEAGADSGSAAAAGPAAAGEGPPPAHPGLDQSARCMRCHVPGSEHPLRPHGLGKDSLRRIARDLPEAPSGGNRPLALALADLGPEPPTGPEEGLACATCHREHGGRDARLTRMGDMRCQTCHRVQFASFGRGHPELDLPGPGADLPYGFDHAAHEAEYFPEEDAEFSCTGCHGGASGGGAMGERGFQAMCADCHAEEIRADGLTVFQLPGVDYEVLRENGVSVGTWPVDAGIDLVTPISPLMRVLLSADSAAAADLRRLEGVDLYFLPEEMDEATLRSAGSLPWSVKELFHGLATGGREELAARLERGLGTELTEAEAAALVDQREVDEPRPSRPGWLPALRAARQAWLPGLEDELSRRAAGEEVPLRVLTDYGEPRSPAESWRIDFDFAIRYVPEGHADVFLRELVEVSDRAARDDSLAREVFASLTDPDAPGRCGKCHTPTEARAAGDEGRWMEGSASPDLGRLTRFDHEPHLAVACRDCHRMAPEGGMEPTERSTCASCHTGDRAAGSCLNCHSYHAEDFSGSGERSVLHPPASAAEQGDRGSGEGGAEGEGTDADSATNQQGGAR